MAKDNGNNYNPFGSVGETVTNFFDNTLEGTKWGEAYDETVARSDAFAAGANAIKNGQTVDDAINIYSNTYRASRESDINSNTKKLIGGADVGIADLTEGISHAGMEAYLEELKATVLTETINVINNEADALQNAINVGWQGRARDVFFDKFNTVRSNIAEDLTQEYYDLVARLQELEDNYFNQDKKMLEFME